MTQSLPVPGRPPGAPFRLLRAVRPVLLFLLTLLDPPALAQQPRAAPVETVSPSVYPTTEPPLPEPDLSLPVSDAPSPTPSASPPSATPQSWLDRLRSGARSAEEETGATVFKLKTEFERLRDEMKRRAERLTAEAKVEAQNALTDLDAWTSQTRELLEHSAGALEIDTKTGVLRMARDVESDADAEYRKLRQKIRPYVEDAEAWAEKTKNEVENELANVAEDTLSEARSILRDLSSHAPAPVPAPVVPPINSALSDVALPMQVASFPRRPAPFLELGNPFFGKGYIGPGFRIPTGTMIQPQFFFYGLFRTGVQTFDNGVDPRVTQWVNSLQLFANFNATPTERFLIEFRPLDNTSDFSGYNFEPTSGPDSGWQNALNGRVYQLFFEGNFLSLFPGLDNGRNYLLGFDFSIGRQQLFLQSGVLINDAIDMVGLTHPSLFWLGGSATTATFIYGWGNIHRSGGFLSNSAQLIGGYLRNDYLSSTVELDFFYSPASQAAGGDGFYFAGSAIQRFGKINTNFTVASSIATNRLTTDQTTVNNGALLFAQISTDVPGTENILYLNGFWAIEHFTSASRAADAGGPLGQTGLLFAATGLGDFGAALGSTATNSVGSALGYQIFFGNLYRKQLILEIGAQSETVGPTQKAIAAGIQYQQAFGQNWVWVVGAIGALQESKGPLYGLRTELDFSF